MSLEDISKFRERIRKGGEQYGDDPHSKETLKANNEKTIYITYTIAAKTIEVMTTSQIENNL